MSATPAPWPPGKTPYVTPDQLITGQWPTGVAVGHDPGHHAGRPAFAAQQYAVIANICLQASARADQIVNTPLRSTQTTEELEGPNFRVTTQWSSGNGRFLASRWPVTQVTAMQVSPNATWPRSWTVLPAGNFEPEFPVDGLYGASVPSAGAGGQSILFAPGYLGSCGGWGAGLFTPRLQYRVSATYLSGWPHTSLTAAARPGRRRSASTTAPAGPSPARPEPRSARPASSTTRSAAGRKPSPSPAASARYRARHPDAVGAAVLRPRPAHRGVGTA